MVCKNCGANNVDGSVFCANCGASLQVEEAQTQTYTPAPDFGTAPEINPTVEVVDPGKKMGLAAFILGIVSTALSVLCSCVCGCIGPVALIAGVVGLILSVMAVKKSKAVGIDNKQAKIGFILSAVGVALNLIGFIVSLILSASGVMADIMDEIIYY